MVIRRRIALILAILASSCAIIQAQISPGPLSRAHQDLEGATKCVTCHNFGITSRGLKCLECHGEIAHRVEAKTGYHSRVYNATPSQADCAHCHLEHNGRQYPLVKVDRSKKYDHRGLTGFALEGKHAELTCEKCHTPSHIATAARTEIKVKDLKRSFLGLGKECTNCHADPHNAQLGAECTRCHSMNGWKPADGFSHARTAFPLTGLHQNVACNNCHAPRGATAARYKGLPFASCQGCHTDPHKGAFQAANAQASCETCHSTGGWKTLLPSSNFDHQKTPFPLHGKHAEAACSQCHKTNDFSAPIAHAQCRDCHQDVHKGQFNTRAAGSDCAACHNETSFKPALFTRETHQQTAFKLEGKHSSLACEMCHLPAGANAVYKTGKTLCADCHQDPHAGEFRGAPYNGRCDQCHTQTGFTPSTFSKTRHAQTKFALANAHAAVICSDCHKPLPNATAKTERQYHFADQTCTGCHADPHQLSAHQLGPKQAALTCETCHNTRQWREVRAFDHASTAFPLEGAHKEATCTGCHRPNEAPGTSAKNKPGTSPDFSHTPKQCFQCHEDIHGGQFMTGGQDKDCSSCHSITKWSAGSFDHSRTAFSLEGAHAAVRCAQCHTTEKEIDGKTTRIYRGTPTQCMDCHVSNGTPRAP